MWNLFMRIDEWKKWKIYLCELGSNSCKHIKNLTVQICSHINFFP